MITKHEHDLCAAAYILGVFTGLASERTKRWLKQHKNSWLTRTRAVRTAEQVIHHAGAFNPIDVWEMLAVARELGFDVTSHTNRVNQVERNLSQDQPPGLIGVMRIY